LDWWFGFCGGACFLLTSGFGLDWWFGFCGGACFLLTSGFGLDWWFGFCGGACFLLTSGFCSGFLPTFSCSGLSGTENGIFLS